MSAEQRTCTGRRWIGHYSRIMGRNQRWTCPDLPGVEIRHCGHPTALRPYYVIGVEQLHGDTWRLLRDAQRAAEQLPQESMP
jgi:hypothetical protein